MNKPTPGPWIRATEEPYKSEDLIILGKPYGKQADGQEVNVAYVTTSWGLAQAKANASLIVAAVNACFAINPSNPLAVAEAMGECLAALKVVYSIYDGLLDTDAPLDCPEVQAVFRARAALAKLEAKS